MNAMLRILRRGSVLLPAALLVGACSDGGPSEPPVPAALAVGATVPAIATVNSVLAPSVLVTDSRNRPVTGATVSFTVTAGGGTVANATASSNAEGIASPGTWTLGTTSGGNTLVASFGSLPPVSITVNATAAAAAAIEPATGNLTSGTAGMPLASPGVLATDPFGNPVQGVQVTFAPAAGSGSVSGAIRATGPDGIARPTSWTLGQTAGSQTLHATSGALSTSLTIEAVAGPAGPPVRLSAATQTGRAGEAAAQPPSVRIQDQFGNVIAGATVTFTVTAGGGSVTGGVQVADGGGVATVGSWTLGPVPGSNTLMASVASGVATQFTAVGLDESGLILEKMAGDGTTCPINRDGCVFAVRASLAAGQPAVGQTVVWSSGGTTVNAVTDLRGIATALNIPPNNATGARTQTATLEATGQTVTFGYTLVPDNGFSIDIRFIGAAPTAAVQAAFAQASARWESVITGDLADVQMTTPADQCGTHPALNEVVDDLLVLVVVDSIDGPGQVLGSAGPCYIRNSNSLPIVGRMRLDSADLAVLAGNGRLLDVVLHELGHTLGFPVLWSDSYFGLLQDTATSNPYYDGARGSADFVIAGGALVNGVGVPVENTGGAGTRHGHWRESVLATELMTGFISGTSNPLSRITVGSLLDIGYQVNFGAADAYLLPGQSLQGPGGGPLLELRELPLPKPRVVY